MPQTVLSVVVEVQPESASALRKLVTDFRDGNPYGKLKQQLPLLHFMAITIFADDQYDPIFILEANFDGPAGPFWAQLESAIGPLLRDMIRCAKPPRDGTAAMFAAVTCKDSRAPVAPYLEARTVLPAVAHQGNRGLDRARIAGERALFLRAEALLDLPGEYRGLDATRIHAKLRAALIPEFSWLEASPPPRIGAGESIADYARLIAFGLLALIGLALPGLFLLLLLPAWLGMLVGFAATALFLVRLRGTLDQAQEISPAADLPPEPRAVGAAAGYLVVTLLLAVACFNTPPTQHGPVAFLLIGLCLMLIGGVVPTVLGLLAWLRWLERRDASQDVPPRDEDELRGIAQSEDRVVQNHMFSVVHIKPGVLRAIVIRAGLSGLGLVLRVVARDGYLASMRTIHFAHWAIVSGGSRLMFVSNFDGTWESYLDDFIEKAHGGLTLAWSSCIGFPPTRFLVLDGATSGRRFKAWARHSMAESLFWFSAYQDLSVNQIERQARIADKLRKPVLTRQEADEWTMDL